VPLSQCLELYAKREVVQEYDCDKCKEKKDALVDTKISRTPDILVVHLKRFAYQNGYLEKIEDLVTFPVNSLDLKRQLAKQIQVAGGGAEYDLYGVVNHMMYHTSGGHYTSYVNIGDKWYACNDAAIQPLDKNDLISKDAYLLFYKKKELSASNIINLRGHTF